MDDQKDHAEVSGKTRDDAERYVVETIAADRIITDSAARAEFDVEAIIAELQTLTGDYDFDQITTDQFMEIVAKHDNTAKG